MSDQIEKRLDDHEERIRFLEKAGTETQMKLLSIEQKQADLKITVLEGNKQTNDNLTKLLNKFVDNEISNSRSKRSIEKNKWNLVFKIWAVAGPIITAAAAYFMKK